MRGRIVAGCAVALVSVVSCAASAARPGPRSAAPVVRALAAASPGSLSVERSTVPTRCPATLANPAVVGTARVDLDLVPVAAIRVDVCSYTSGALAAHVTILDGASADAVENAANTLQGQDPGSGSLCQPDADNGYLVLFWDGLHGTGVRGATAAACADVTNGFLTASPTAPWTSAIRRLETAASQCASRFGSAAGCVIAGHW